MPWALLLHQLLHCTKASPELVLERLLLQLGAQRLRASSGQAQTPG